MKLLRTIRLDPSDTFVFEKAAEPGEWAVSGAFVFWNTDPAVLEGKARSAFRGGFLGVGSLGWSTLAQIVDAEADDRSAAIERLAGCLVERYGAPNLDAARLAATEEVDFSASLCDRPAGTLIAVRRTVESGEIRESFRSLRPRSGATQWQAPSFLVVEDEPEETVDLSALARGERR